MSNLTTSARNEAIARPATFHQMGREVEARKSFYEELGKIRRGTLPSNATLESWLSKMEHRLQTGDLAPERRDRVMSEGGQQLLEHVENFVDSMRRVIREKNRGNEIQDYLYHSKLAATTARNVLKRQEKLTYHGRRRTVYIGGKRDTTTVSRRMSKLAKAARHDLLSILNILRHLVASKTFRATLTEAFCVSLGVMGEKEVVQAVPKKREERRVVFADSLEGAQVPAPERLSLSERYGAIHDSRPRSASTPEMTATSAGLGTEQKPPSVIESRHQQLHEPYIEGDEARVPASPSPSIPSTTTRTTPSGTGDLATLRNYPISTSAISYGGPASRSEPMQPPPQEAAPDMNIPGTDEEILARLKTTLKTIVVRTKFKHVFEDLIRMISEVKHRGDNIFGQRRKRRRARTSRRESFGGSAAGVGLSSEGGAAMGGTLSQNTVITGPDGVMGQPTSARRIEQQRAAEKRMRSAAQAVREVPSDARHDLNYDQAAKELRSIVGQFANQTELIGLFDRVYDVHGDAMEDYALRGYFSDWYRYLSECVEGNGTFLNKDEYMTRGLHLLERGRTLRRQQYNAQFTALRQEMKRVWQGFQVDPITQAIATDLKALTDDIFVREAMMDRRPRTVRRPQPTSTLATVWELPILWLRPGLVTDLRTTFLPILMQQMKFLPVPRIESTSDDIDMVFDNIVIEAETILPSDVDIENTRHLHIDPAGLLGAATEEWLSGIKVKMSGLQTNVKDVHFWYRKKTGFPKLKDKGFVDFVIGGKGIQIDIDLMMAPRQYRDVKTFVVRDVTCKVDKVDMKFRDVNHGILYKMMGPSVRKTVRKSLGSMLEEQIKRFLFSLDHSWTKWRYPRSTLTTDDVESNLIILAAIGDKKKAKELEKYRKAQEKDAKKAEKARKKAEKEAVKAPKTAHEQGIDDIEPIHIPGYDSSKPRVIETDEGAAEELGADETEEVTYRTDTGGRTTTTEPAADTGRSEPPPSRPPSPVTETVTTALPLSDAIAAPSA